MLNKVMIIGRLGRDPELRYSQSGSPVCTLNIATDESYTDRDGNRVDRAEWHRVVVFQKAAENCSQYLTKGSLVFVEGSLQTRKWQDQQGQDRYTTEIKAQRVQFLDKRGGNRAVCPAARAAAKAATALPAVLRRLSREAAAVPSSARSSGRTITKIWARRFLPRPAAWTTCRSREIWGRERGTFLQKGSPFPSQAPPFPLPRRLTDEEAARKEFVPRYGWGDGISVFDSKVTFPHHTACPLMATPPKHAPSDHRGAPWKEASSVFHP